MNTMIIHILVGIVCLAVGFIGGVAAAAYAASGFIE